MCIRDRFLAQEAKGFATLVLPLWCLVPCQALFHFGKAPFGPPLCLIMTFTPPHAGHPGGATGVVP
eukprot:5249734-Prorocentrum_lima.AAC.1